MISTGFTLGILLVGVITVVGGVLVLRLHAFLALVIGALLVGMLTPSTALERYALEKEAIRVQFVDADREVVVLEVSARPGAVYLVLRWEPERGTFSTIAELHVDRTETIELADGTQAPRSTARIVSSDPELRVLADDIVIDPRDREAATTLAGQTVGERLAAAFGSTCAKIGILIAMASIIGKCLLDSGAADRIVRSALQFLGERRAPMAFVSSGFLLGIPVFFDTVFYLMIPLGKAMRMRTGHSYLLYVLAIVAGGTMAHSLVPPTPGPLFVAEALGVDIGTMILAGFVVGVFTSGFGLFYASWANRKWELPLRESPGFSLEELSGRDDKDLPPFWLSLLPIGLPVVLIGGVTVLRPFADNLPAGLTYLASTLGNKNIALALSAGIAMITLVRNSRMSRQELASSVQSALASGGTIILITAAGGAFGAMLQQTGVAGLIRELPQGTPVLVILMAFLITAAIRTAQGSATVAMITAVGILAGIGSSEELGFHPVYLALAVGCGSKPIAWMNDSGFWVMSRMSGMTEGETLKYVTPMTTLMGVVGLVITMIGVTLFPLA